MIPLEQALDAYPLNLHPLPAEDVPLAAALNRVLAEPAVAATDLPRFDQSAMDGYALRAADTAQASAAAPTRLPVSVRLAAGPHENLAPLAPGTAARIFTGAPLPPGADTVLPQERAVRDGETLLFTAPWPQKNIRWRGEELRAGSAVAAAGQRITPGLLASLVNADLEHVRAARRPRIRVLVTGDEVRPVGTPLKPGEIHDSNGPLIGAVLQRWGYPAPQIEHLHDDAAQVRDTLERALNDADVVISAGGASVGEHDFLPATAESLGLRRVFWKVAQKPAKPLFFGVRDNRVHLALPGNPGAVLISMALHVRRALDCLEGVARPGPSWSAGRLAQAVERDPQRVRLLRMSLDYDSDATALLQPLPKQDSHMLSNLAAAQVLAWVPAGEGRCEAGSVLRWTALP
ncbi:MAG: molybdopterin molybdotransferase MoeA [Nevskia sp.]|nr:molybdopterin molybdotransferase MoeA [Nevskia sp.]